MIARLTGRIARKSPQQVILDDCLYVFLFHLLVEDPFGLDHDDGTLGAKTVASGRDGKELPVKAPFLQLLVELLVEGE